MAHCIGVVETGLSRVRFLGAAPCWVTTGRLSIRGEHQDTTPYASANNASAKGGEKCGIQRRSLWARKRRVKRRTRVS